MNKNYKLASVLGGLFIACSAMFAQEKATVTMFKMDDGSRILKVSDNGKWAVGNSNVDALDHSPHLYDVEKGTVVSLLTEEEIERSVPGSAQDASDDGVVVGSHNLKAGYYKDGKWNYLPLPDTLDVNEISSSNVVAVSADGKTMVGNVYVGESKCYPCMWVEGVLQSVNMPEKDWTGSRANMNQFQDISGDGTLAVGAISYNVLPGRSEFIYRNNEYHIISEDWVKIPLKEGAYPNFLEDQLISPDGKWMAGHLHTGYSTGEDQFDFEEYWGACYYEVESDQLVDIAKDNQEVQFTALDNDGIFYACTPIHYPYGRVPMIYTNYDDRQFMDFCTVIKEHYDLDILDEIGLETGGTIMGVSADGRVIVACGTLGGINYIVKLPYGIRKALDPANIQSEKIAKAPKVTINGGELTIVGDNAVSMTITDLSGATIKSANVSSSTVSVSELNKGMYIVTLNMMDGNQYTSKICIK